MTGEQVVLANDLHDRMKAPVVDAVALHHVGACSQVKHADGSHMGSGLVEAQRLVARPAFVSLADIAVGCTARKRSS